MKMEPIVSSETSAIRTQTPRNYPKRNNLYLEHGESLRTRMLWIPVMRSASNFANSYREPPHPPHSIVGPRMEEKGGGHNKRIFTGVFTNCSDER